MRRVAFIILFFSFVKILAAQSVPTFSKFYTQDSLYGSGSTIIRDNDSLILLAAIYDGLTFQGHLFIKTDLGGNEAYRNTLIKKDTIYSGHHGLTVGATSSNCLIWPGEIYPAGANSAINVLYKLKNSLDTAYIKALAYPGCSILSDARELSDKNYLITGGESECTGNFTLDAALVKTDTLGNILWHIEEPHPNHTLITNPAVMPGGFYATLLVGTDDNTADSIFEVRKYDNDGNVKWRLPLGVPGHYNKTGPLIATMDGGGIKVLSAYDTAGNTANPVAPPAVIYKFDSNGNIIWQKWLRFGQFVSAHELSNGDLIFAENLTCPPFSGPFSQYLSGDLFRLTKDGDLIWEQRFINGVDTNYRNYFFDVTQASDGGIVAVGQAMELATHMQKAWLLKVDSNGCIDGDCPQLHTAINESGITEGKIILFPSPASASFTIAFTETDYFRQYKDIEFSLYDLAGRVVKQEPLQDQATTIHRDGLASGIYTCKISGSGSVFYTNKVVFK